MLAVKVTIFEDSKAVREAISLLVQGTHGLELAGAFPDCNNVIDDIKSSYPDIVLMDIGIPGINGVEAVKLIKKNFPDLKVIMQTVFEDDDKIFAALCAGASGYLLKDTPPSRLMEGILEAHQGGVPMSPSIARKALNLFQKFLSPLSGINPSDYHLTAREKEILQCMSRGLSYKMIADACNISFDTVRAHIRHIYEKLHVASMSEAVAKALRERLV
ncbi:MAG TPA: response regulator transcription factor [Puia sp.]|nr:response regulator transcription factor [Puia sp.]